MYHADPLPPGLLPPQKSKFSWIKLLFLLILIGIISVGIFWSVMYTMTGNKMGDQQSTQPNQVITKPTLPPPRTGAISFEKIGSDEEYRKYVSAIYLERKNASRSGDLRFQAVPTPTLMTSGTIPEIYRLSSSTALLTTDEGNSIIGTDKAEDLPIPLVGTKNGLVLAINEMLVISDTLENKPPRIVGYSIDKPQNPQKAWEVQMYADTTVKSIQEQNGGVIAVVSSPLSPFHQCPLKVADWNGSTYTINCGDVYWPNPTYPADTIITVLFLDTKTGQIQASASTFSDLTSETSWLLGKDSFYFVYDLRSNAFDTMIEFLSTEDGKKILPDEYADRIKKIATYDITYANKISEIAAVMSSRRHALQSENLSAFQTSFQTSLDSYIFKNAARYIGTGISKFRYKDFALLGNVRVPGRQISTNAFREYGGSIELFTMIRGSDILDAKGGNMPKDSYFMNILGPDLSIVGKLDDIDFGSEISIHKIKFINSQLNITADGNLYTLDLNDSTLPTQIGVSQQFSGAQDLYRIDDSHILVSSVTNDALRLLLVDMTNPKAPVVKTSFKPQNYGNQLSDGNVRIKVDSPNNLIFVLGKERIDLLPYTLTSEIEIKNTINFPNSRSLLQVGTNYVLLNDQEIQVIDGTSFKKINSYPLGTHIEPTPELVKFKKNKRV